ncbi:MAG TPA: DUF5985 family protein [Fimbriiglobus sp.]|nr:DUF5985 family protein [Fimbriiglobus sp.]
MGDISAEVTAGALAMGFAVAGLIFLRFWRDTHDRLFAFFALAFFILTVNRLGTGLYPQFAAQGDHLYWVRFFAFVVILLAIVDKNRTRTPPPAKPPG